MQKYTIKGYVTNKNVTREGTIEIIWDGKSKTANDAITGSEWEMFADKFGIDAHQVNGEISLIVGKITDEQPIECS